MAQSDISRSGASAQDSSEGASASLDKAAAALQTRLGDEASGLGNEAKQLAQDVAGRARDTAQERLSNGKERAVQSLSSVADALRHTGQHLRLQDEESLPTYIDRAAEKLESVSGYLRDKELGDVVGDIESFARREPAIFIGGAFALGLLGGRFLKSSSGAPRNQLQSSRQGSETIPPASSARPAGRSSQRRKGQRTSLETQRAGEESPFNGGEATSASAGALSDTRQGDG
jgi:hypothetical protein